MSATDPKAENSGFANNSSWNTSPYAFSPNTNTLNQESMPSKQAQAARDKSAQIMEALKNGDTAKANELMGKDETGGRMLPGVSWIKGKINRRKGSGK
jgi:hypothetical protein